MLLETLLLSPCFLTGKTSLNDSHTLSVSNSDYESDETLLFFDIDDQTNPCCKLRELFWKENEEGHLLCDLLVFYAKGNKRIFCFVELKKNKGKIHKSGQQLISTYDAFKRKIAIPFQNEYIAKAFICCSKGSVPQELKTSLTNLNKKFSACAYGGKPEFLSLLREKSSDFQPKGKRKKIN